MKIYYTNEPQFIGIANGQCIVRTLDELISSGLSPTELDEHYWDREIEIFQYELRQVVGDTPFEIELKQNNETRRIPGNLQEYILGKTTRDDDVRVGEGKQGELMIYVGNYQGELTMRFIQNGQYLKMPSLERK